MKSAAAVLVTGVLAISACGDAAIHSNSNENNNAASVCGNGELEPGEQAPGLGRCEWCGNFGHAGGKRGELQERFEKGEKA